MITRLLTRLAIVCAAITLLSGVARAAILYDNGPYDGTVNGWTINDGFSVADAFDAPDGSTVTGVTLVTWNFPGDILQSVDWQISSGNPLSGGSFTVLGSGTGLPSVSDLGVNGYSYDLQTAEFSIDPVVLTGGDYWLLLLNAVVSPSGNPIFWDQNSGPSAAWENTLGDLSQAGENNNCSGPCTASETFQILTTDVPEPSSTALMLVGLIAMVATSRRWTGATAGMRGGRTFLSSASGSPPSAP